MKISSVRYLAGEGIKNAWVNRLMTIASIGVLVACMVIIGLALLISENVNIAVGSLEQQNVVMVYMEDYNWALYAEKTESSEAQNASSEGEAAPAELAEEADANGVRNSDYAIHNEEEAKALCGKIADLENVASAEYISSEQGLKTVTEIIPRGQEGFFSFLNDEFGNPVSCAAKVKMVSMEHFDDTLKAIEKLDGVDVIQSQGDLADKINAIKNGIGVAGFWIIAILLIIALVIVSNTIRVTMYNRKLEISIMKAVGATDAFVRIPFVVEGMLIGLVSALISEGMLYFCYRVAIETISNTLGTDNVVQFGDMAWLLFGVCAGIGIFAGALGSVIMIGRYLRHEGSEFAAI